MELMGVMGISMEALQQEFTTMVSQPILIQNIVRSLILLATLLILRLIFIKNVEKWRGLQLDSRRKLIVAARNFTVIAFVIGNFVIWGYQIKEFAFSVAAIAVACVMTFKEVIANFMGGVSRTISHGYSIGDRIKIGDFRGDIIDTDMLTTTIMEVGPGDNMHIYTGSSICVPNSILLNTPVVNESFMQGYMLHIFDVPVNVSDNWRHKEKMLLRATNFVCEPYLNKARNYMEATASKLSIEPPSSTPRVLIHFVSPEELALSVRVPVPLRRKGKVEQEIIRKYLEFIDNQTMKETAE